MLKKIMCLCISILLANSVFFTAHAVESETLRNICENEKTVEAIEAMTESSELELYVALKCPETGSISCALQNLSPEEFEAKKDEIYEIYRNFCYKFIEDHSIIEPTYCPLSTIIICKLTLKDIENIIIDERFESFSILESGIEVDGSETDTDYLEDYEVDTDSWRNSCDYMGNANDDSSLNLLVDTDSWENSCDKLGDYVIRGDINDDDSLDMLDVTVTQKFIAKLDTKCNTKNADMDENGNVDLQDVVQMQKAIAGLI